MYLKAKGKAKLRQDLEAKIIVTVIDEALKQRYRLMVIDGNGDKTIITSDKQTIVDAIMECDDDYLFIFDTKSDNQIGWVRFVYGNGGFDVMSDWSANPETNKILEPALEIVNQY